MNFENSYVGIRNEKDMIEIPQYRSSLYYGIWIYFFLLIFEGALRKWFLPGLSTPLLIIRDPLALYLILSCWYKNLLPANLILSGFILSGIIGFFTAGFFGHGNLFVALYGARIFLIHLPLMFVIGSIFSIADVKNFGRLLLWLSLPMTLLIALQFFSPQTSWINIGVGGDVEGSGFGGALGYFRPSGTFSFTNGTSLFFSLASSFLFYFYLNPKEVSKRLLLFSTAAIFIAIPLSISRGLFFQVIVCFVFTLIAISGNPKYLFRMVLAAILGIFTFIILTKLHFFNIATEVFTSRFENANKTEGGIEGVFLDRFLGGMIGAFSDSTSLPFWGHGIGMGSNVGSMLLTGGSNFLIAEEEWGRIIGELGPLLGIYIILLRVSLVIKISFDSYKMMVRGDFLPWLLLSFGIFNIMQGQWAQPTSLGFSVIIAGLILATLNKNSSEQIHKSNGLNSLAKT